MEYLAVGPFFANAYVMTIVVLISTFLQSTLSNNFNHLVISEGIHLKTALNVRSPGWRLKFKPKTKLKTRFLSISVLHLQ